MTPDPTLIEQVPVAAAAIVDIWMGGDQSWRGRLSDSDFLESGDWQRACEEATAVLATLPSEAIYKRIFLAGYSDGWIGNQHRRDVQHVDAEKGWSLYVKNGALDKAMRATTPTAPILSAAVSGEAAEPPLLSEQPFSAGADHAPGSVSRDGSAAPVQDDEPMLTPDEEAELVDRINGTPNLQPVQDDDAECVTISMALYRFLLGEGPLDGVWFGDNPIPAVKSGAFWWRKALRRLSRLSPTPETDQQGGVPASPSGHSPEGGAAISVASPAKPSVPNA